MTRFTLTGGSTVLRRALLALTLLAAAVSPAGAVQFVVPGFQGTAEGVVLLCRSGTSGNGAAPCDANTPLPVAPTTGASSALAPVSSAALETGHVLKASSGTLYTLSVTTTTAGGYVMIFNSATVPADGTVAPAYCLPISASSAVPFQWNNGVLLNTGVSVVFSASTSCFTKTSSATAFFTGQVQ